MSYGANLLPAANTVWKRPPSVPRQGGKVTWRFSIVDVVSVLTDSADANAYRRKLKQRLRAEGIEPVATYHGLKMPATDGGFF